MGREARCTIEHHGRPYEGRALLETKDVQLRAPELRVDLPFADLVGIEATADGWLELRTAAGLTRIQLGADAAKWAERIRHPPSAMEKLGIGPGTAVRLIGSVDPALRAEVQGREARVVRSNVAAAVLLFAPAAVSDLAKLADLRAAMADDAAVWVVWPKGRKELTETHVREAALAAGLVDVKVASVSEALSGLKLVIRRADRAASGKKKA
jgi:hypothetical protein